VGKGRGSPPAPIADPLPLTDLDHQMSDYPILYMDFNLEKVALSCGKKKNI